MSTKQQTTWLRNATGILGRQSRIIVAAVIIMIIAAALGIVRFVQAETYPGGSDNGQTSYVKSLTTSLTGLGYGSTTNTPDWGANWNRVATAATWTPSGDAAVSNVKAGKKFYSNNRTQQTGTYPAPGPCSTQAYHDNYGAPVTQTTNCTSDISWTTPSDGITGTDKQDPRTGLIWSKYLQNNSGTLAFVDSGGSTFSWDATGAANIAVGNKTAIQLCTAMGNGWRLPTQKELMQVYIDGSFFNLSNPSNFFWSATQYSGTYAWYVALYNGTTATNTFGTLYAVRCVR